MLTALLVAIAGAVISVVDAHEFPNIGTGMWWAIVTVTTVGYGDFAPHTAAGRIVGACLMLVGIGLLSLLTATVASSFVAADEERAQDQMDELVETVRRIDERLERLESAS